ncbi:MAG: hypothetical protein WD294_07195 [Phycisphaeraceae bacterium]
MNNDWESKDPFNQPEAGEEGNGLDPNTLDMIDDSGGFEEFAPPKSKSNGMLVLVLAVVVGAGALWGMRMAGSGDPVSAPSGEAEQKIEAALARFAGGDDDGDPALATRHALDVLFRDTDDVIALFSDDPTHNQVGLKELQKNPFKLLITRSDSDGDESGETEVATVDSAERERKERLAKIQQEYKTLKVQSVLTGDPSLAVVNDVVVRVGETVGSFEVTSIGPQGVRMTAEGETFTLRLTQPEDGRAINR